MTTQSIARKTDNEKVEEIRNFCIKVLADRKERTALIGKTMSLSVRTEQGMYRFDDHMVTRVSLFRGEDNTWLQIYFAEGMIQIKDKPQDGVYPIMYDGGKFCSTSDKITAIEVS